MLRKKPLRRTAKTSLLLERLYVSLYFCLLAVLTERFQLREGRKAELEKHVEAVNSMIREANVASDASEQEHESEEEPWDGITESRDPVVDHEDEYMDDDRFTTVTVEAVDVSKDGLKRLDQNEENESDASGPGRPDAERQRSTMLQGRTGTDNGKRVWTKQTPSGPKKRKKKFRYESKAERKATRYMEKSGNKAKARARKA